MKKEKNNKGNYVITFPLITEPWQEDLLNKFFKHCCDIQNKLIKITLPVFNKHKDEIFKNEERILELCAKKKKSNLNKEETNELSALYEEKKNTLSAIKTDEIKGLVSYPKTIELFSEFGLGATCTKLLKDNIGGTDKKHENLKYNSTFPQIASPIADNIGKRVYCAYEKHIWGNGKFVHYKKNCVFNTVSFCVRKGYTFATVDVIKHNLLFKSSIGIHNGKTMTIPFKVKFDKCDEQQTLSEGQKYEMNALNNQEIKIIGIKRTFVRGKFKFELQLTFEGKPYSKNRTLGNGDVGADPGVSSLTLYGKTVRQFRAPDNAKKIEQKINELQRYIKHTDKLLNPNKFNENGTLKKGDKAKWKHSNNNLKARKRKKELERQLKEKTKLSQIEFANSVLSEGNVLKIEDNDISNWNKNLKGIRKDKNGKILSNKKYGKSIKRTAPAQCLTILKRKYKSLGGTVIDINEKARATGTDHTNGVYTYRPVSQREVTLSNGNTHHRDAHAAFNLKYYNNNTKHYDFKKMSEDYQHFCQEESNAFKRNELK